MEITIPERDCRSEFNEREIKSILASTPPRPKRMTTGKNSYGVGGALLVTIA